MTTHKFLFASRIVVPAIAALLLCSGCGLFGKKDKQPVYAGSHEVEPLQVPEDLDPPRTDTALTIAMDDIPALSEAPSDVRPPLTLGGTRAENANAAIRYGAKGIYLEVKDSLESTWRRLGITIERSGMQLNGRDQTAGEYRFDYHHHQEQQRKNGFFSRLLFWRRNDGEDYSGSYQAKLEADGELTRVYLNHVTGQAVEDDAAETILTVFLNRLG